MTVATEGAGAAVVAALHLSSGGLAAAIATGATAGAIGGATYGFTESLLSGNDAATVAKDTVIGGVSGGVTGGILAGAAYGIQKGASAIGNAIKGNNTPLRQDPLGSNGGACFVAGTLVLTSLGLKAIENIQPGDKVLAADPETGRQEEKEVVRTFVKETDTLVHLRISGEEIVTTETHPFYVDGEGWVTAGELTEEDYVLDSEGRRLQVEEKYVEELEESVKVYNFEVEEYHTYYVGDAGILVHNKCWDDSLPKNTTGNNQKGISGGNKNPESIKRTGRAKNNLRPDPNATGAHSTFKRDPVTGKITNYATYRVNPKNPTGFDEVIRYDGVGSPHRNKVTGEELMPHVHDKKAIGGLRGPEKWEIPK